MIAGYFRNESSLLKSLIIKVQRSAKRLVRGCEKYVPALAYLLCLALPGSCLVRFAYFLADLCTCLKGSELVDRPEDGSANDRLHPDQLRGSGAADYDILADHRALDAVPAQRELVGK